MPVLIIVTDININLLLIIESANLFYAANLFDTVAVIIINYLNFDHFLMRFSQFFNLALVINDFAADFTTRTTAFSNDNTQYD